MEIKETNNGRAYFDHLLDIDTIGNDPKGFNRHWDLTGFFLSLIGFSFKDPDGGYLNKKSVVHYLTRNINQINLSDEEKAQIGKLNNDSTIQEVETLFKKVKSIELGLPTIIPEKPIDAVFPKSLTIFGRYDRANEMNNETIVRLMDGKTAYAANRVQPIKDGRTYIVAESPKGSDAIYRDENWNEISREKSEDKKYYYEMVWKESCPPLVSAADVYNSKRDLDKDNFDFLAEGEEANFLMTSGENLFVKCISAVKDDWFEIRTLELTSGDTTKTTQQWILKGAFGYDNDGLVKAKTLYQNLTKNRDLSWNDAQLIINCNTGKDRSAALIMWIEIFRMLDLGTKIEDVTHENLQAIAKDFESQTVKGGLTDHIRNTLPKYFPKDSDLQKALSGGENAAEKI